MGSKSKELGVRHTNRERPLVGTYAVRTFALLSVVSGVRSSQFGVRIWRLAVGRASPVAYWSSVRRKHFAAALSCQPINSHICVELQCYSVRVRVCVWVWVCACTPTNNWHLRQSLFWSRPNCKLKFAMLLLLPSATAATGAFAAAVCSCSSSDFNVQWTVSYGRPKAEGTEHGARCCTAYAIVPLLNSIASVYRLPFTWIFTRPAAFATRRGIAL